jgi:cobalt/nickel transport system permease protein
MGKSKNRARILAASLVSVVVALQLGAFSVVLETFLSGKSELPFSGFILLMQPIHLAIGVIEGFVTAGVVNYIYKARPEIVESITSARPMGAEVSLKKVLIVFAAMAVLTGGTLSWFASTHPDGLEWAIERIYGKSELPEQDAGIAVFLKGFQEKTAFLPNYGFRSQGGNVKEKEAAPAWPGVETGTSVAGIIGSAIVLTMIALIGVGIRIIKRKHP